MTSFSISALIMAGITIYVGLSYLLIYFQQPQRRENRTFALMCVSTGLYDIFCAGLYSATSVTQGAQWQRAQVIALALASIALLWFIIDYTAHKPGRWARVLTVYFALAAIVGVIDRGRLTWLVDQPVVKNIRLPFGLAATYYEVTPGPLTNLQSVMGVVLFIYILWISVCFYRSGRQKQAAPLLATMAVLFAGTLNDICVSSGLYQFIYLIEYAYTGIVLLMTCSLTTAIIQAAQSQDALRESEEKYRALFHLSPAPAALVSMNGVIMDCNDATVQLCGMRREQLVGKPFTQLGLFGEAELPHYIELLAQLEQAANMGPLELKITSADRQPHWIEAFVSVLKKGEENQAIQVMTRDVSEQRRTEKLLRIQRDLGVALGETSSLAEALKLVLAAALHVEGIDSGGIYQVDACSGDIDLIAHQGLSPQFAEHVRHYGAETLQARLIHAGEPIYKQYAQLLPQTQDLISQGEGLRALAIVPIKRKSADKEASVVASLNMASHMHDDIPTGARHALELLALQIGGAISRIETEEALRRERDLVSRITETSPVGIVMVNRDGQITFANTRAEQVLGLSKTDLHQCAYNAPEWHTTDYDGHPFPDDELPFARVMRTRQTVFDVRHAIEWPNGQRVLISVNAAPLLDKDGQADGMVATAEDVTARVRAEQTLKESEKRFRNIIESIPLGMHMYQLEPDGRLVFTGANPAADEILGIENSQFVGKTIEEAFPGLAETEAPEHYRIAAAEGVAWQSEQINYDGGKISGAFLVHAFQTSPGQMAAAFLDITQRKQAEEAILRLQHMLQDITDSMPSALIALDPAGHVLTWNPVAETLTGKTAAQMLGRPLWPACPELARYHSLFERVVRTGQIAHQHKEQWITQSGTTYYDVSVYPLLADGINGAVLRIDDVTRRVQLEEMMLQSAKMASVGGLAAGVAHEINNPLGAMIQSAQMLQVSLDTQRPRTREWLEACGVAADRLAHYLQERKVIDYLNGIREAGERAAKIVSDLLSFSRKSSSKSAPHNLNTLIEQTLSLAITEYDLEKKYDFRNLDIVREMAGDLPDVICDRQQIQQVILNLVRNAAQAMAHKKTLAREYQPRLVLRTSYRKDSPAPSDRAAGALQHRGWVRMEVQDNGPGLPDRLRERLFEPFFTTKDVGEGTGLGLWLCWSIVVERHKGRMWAEPVAEQGEIAAVEKGTRFVVELPLVFERMGENDE